MPDPAVVFRTNDPTKWGIGLGRNLTAPEGDNNTWEFLQAIIDLNNSRPQPDNIVSITQNGARFTLNLQSGAILPEIVLPVLQIRWRNFWLPDTAYLAIDSFRVEGKGIYSVLIPHTSAATFDENAVDIDDNPLYNKIWSDGSDAQSGIYDIVIYYPGVLADLPAAVPLYQERCLRSFILRAAPADLHTVYLDEAPATVPQVMTIYSNDTAVGTITVAVGQNVGTVVLTADETYLKNDRFSIGKPATADTVAAGLSLGFAAERII